jgi:hypothetical protein
MGKPKRWQGNGTVWLVRKSIGSAKGRRKLHGIGAEGVSLRAKLLLYRIFNRHTIM